eukprot:scaffold2224_cov261-Pinguiococcus_pyrenoidosus.AAC.37
MILNSLVATSSAGQLLYPLAQPVQSQLPPPIALRPGVRVCSAVRRWCLGLPQSELRNVHQAEAERRSRGRPRRRSLGRVVSHSSLRRRLVRGGPRWIIEAEERRIFRFLQRFAGRLGSEAE